MQVNSMPNCCAASVIVNFGHTSTNAATWGSLKDSPTPEEVYDYLIKKTKVHHMYKIYINEDQYKAIGKAIVKAGFRRTCKMFHRNHMNWVYEYTKIVS